MKVVEIEGYDVMLDLLLHKSEAERTEYSLLEFENMHGNIIIKKENNFIIICRNQTSIYKFDIAQFVEKLVEEYGLEPEWGVIESESLIVIEENSYVGVKLIFNLIHGEYAKDGEGMLIQAARVRVLLNFK